MRVKNIAVRRLDPDVLLCKSQDDAGWGYYSVRFGVIPIRRRRVGIQHSSGYYLCALKILQCAGWILTFCYAKVRMTPDGDIIASGSASSRSAEGASGSSTPQAIIYAR